MDSLVRANSLSKTYKLGKTESTGTSECYAGNSGRGVHFNFRTVRKRENDAPEYYRAP